MTREKSPVFLFDDVRVDAESFKLWKAGQPVPVEPKAFEVLLFLVRNSGRLVEKDELLDSVWKETTVTENALTREIAKLRRLLGDDPKRARYIQTVHTRGYRFIAEVEIKNGDATTTNGNGSGHVEEEELGKIAVEEPQAVVAAPEHAPRNGHDSRNGSHVSQNGTHVSQNGARVPTNGSAAVTTATLAQHIAVAPQIAVASPQAKVVEAAPKRRPVVFVKRLLVVAVAALCLAGAFFARKFYLANSRPTPPTVLEMTQVTSAPELDLNPTFSPDGNSLAYSSDRGGSFEIYAKSLAPGGREIQLTSDGDRNMEPAWSPGGDLIAYHSSKRGGIWLIPPTGGVARQLTEFGCRPAWSRDGTTVAFQSESFHDMIQPYANSATIWIVPARGGAARQVTKPGAPPGGHLSPTWSPDGRRIAFLGADMNSMQIWSVAVEGGEPVQLSPNGTGDKADVLYAPDGESLYFTMGMMLGVIRVDPATGERIGRGAVVADLGSTVFRHPAVSADGHKIAFSAWTVKSNVASVPISTKTHEATGLPVALTNDLSSRNGLTAFSPDGRKIAYTSMRRGLGYQLWLMDADGGNKTQLSSNQQAAYAPSWTPSGEEVLFESMRGGSQTLSSIAVGSGKERTRAQGEGLELLRLAPDGKRVSYTFLADNFFNVGVMSVEGGDRRQLTFDKSFTAFPCWSPDGKWIAYQSKRGDDTQIMLMPSEGGEPVQLTFDRGDKWPYSFSPDGSKIAFAGERDGVWNVRWISLSDKTEKQLTNNTSHGVVIRFPDWSPLGDRIVYENAELTGNIHVMSLN
jgi:Tol biopolymer transport system component/DNA-binding winged helix-turn-helix (wHTH) protein